MNALAWDGNWAWSIPLIIVTVIFHVVGLALINQEITGVLRYARKRYNFLFSFVAIMGICTLWAILLHSIEASVWAYVYWILGALPDGKSALLYSLGAMTTYGHASYYLAAHWQLMGTLEALDGMMLFGLTTAFLYSMIRQVWPTVDS
jgi:hypothetical protein